LARFLISLFHFLVRGVLAATVAELAQLDPLGCRFSVLGLRIIALFAITALQRNDLSGHDSLPKTASGSELRAGLTDAGTKARNLKYRPRRAGRTQGLLG
jgi:hypothetical protein